MGCLEARSPCFNVFGLRYVPNLCKAAEEPRQPRPGPEGSSKVQVDEEARTQLNPISGCSAAREKPKKTEARPS